MTGTMSSMRRVGTIQNVPWFQRRSEKKRTMISRKIKKRAKAAKMRMVQAMTRTSFD